MLLFLWQGSTTSASCEHTGHSRPLNSTHSHLHANSSDLQSCFVCSAAQPQPQPQPEQQQSQQQTTRQSCFQAQFQGARDRLCRSLAVNEQVVEGVLAVCPDLVREQQLVTDNLQVLAGLPATAQQVKRLVLSTPCLLAAPLQAWQEFLAGYGLQDSQIWQVLVSQPQLLLHGNIFGAGRASMFLKRLGWSDLEVSTLVIQHPQHAAILQVSIEL